MEVQVSLSFFLSFYFLSDYYVCHLMQGCSRPFTIRHSPFAARLLLLALAILSGERRRWRRGGETGLAIIQPTFPWPVFPVQTPKDTIMLNVLTVSPDGQRIRSPPLKCRTPLCNMCSLYCTCRVQRGSLAHKPTFGSPTSLSWERF